MSQALMTLHRVPEFFILGYGRIVNWIKFSAFSHRLGPISYGVIDSPVGVPTYR